MDVLLVENDESLAEPLIDGLARYGMVVRRVSTGAAALRAPVGDFVLVDAALPDIDGLDVCRRLRAAADVPIIILTSRRTSPPSTNSGSFRPSRTSPPSPPPSRTSPPSPPPARNVVDAYVAKPFSTRELVARMHAVDRRHTPPSPGALGPLSIDPRVHEATLHGFPLRLSAKEFHLLTLLADKPGEVVDRRRILESIWDPNFTGSGKTLDFHIAALRRKLGDPRWIQNRRGVGFRLTVPPPTAA
jgi:DNA-binding response OmpR family regulator